MIIGRWKDKHNYHKGVLKGVATKRLYMFIEAGVKGFKNEHTLF